ncbi:MAG: VWA domain-containing protein, partial [Vicinamibacteria bacterium]
VEISYIEVDAIVTDKDGNPVKGLTKDDFEIREEGKTQQVDLAAFVDLPLPAFTAETKDAVVSDVRTNERPFEGRLYVIVLDDLHTGPTRSMAVRQGAQRFIRQYLADGDLAAVIFTSGRSTSQDLTDNRPLLLDSVNKFMGQRIRSSTLNLIDDYNMKRAIGSTDPARDPEKAARGYNARQAIDTLKGAADWLGNIRGRRKAIIYFSEGIDYDISDMFGSSDTSTIFDGTRGLITAATAANTSIYSIDPRGLHSMGEESMDMQPVLDTSLGFDGSGLRNEQRLAADSLRVLAEGTLGRAAVETNDFEGAFERLVKDNSSYYMLGYRSTNEKRDGRFRKLTVKLKRPDLRVRARNGFVAPGGGRKIKPPTWSGSKTPDQLKEMLARPMQESGLLMSVHAAAFRGIGKNANVVVTVQFGPGSFRFIEKGGEFHDVLDLTVAAVNSDSKISGNDTHMNLDLKPQTRRLVETVGFRSISQIDLPPGRYQLRVAARSVNANREGSVHYDLDVPDFSDGSLALSGLVLGSAAVGVVPTAGIFEPLKGATTTPSTTFRTFLPSDTLSLAADVYDNDWKIAHTVDIVTSVSQHGAAKLHTEVERNTAELPEGGAFIHTSSISLKDFSPGEYTLRLEARSRMGKRPSAFRELTFTVSEP